MKILLYLLLTLIIACNDTNQKKNNDTAPFSEEIHIDDDFYFEKGIYQVVDNVYVAIGYGLANSVLIVGETGNIIIDTTEDPALGKQINQEFKKISNLPNEAIIYTHSHVDLGEVLQGFMKKELKFMLTLHLKKVFLIKIIY